MNMNFLIELLQTHQKDISQDIYTQYLLPRVYHQVDQPYLLNILLLVFFQIHPMYPNIHYLILLVMLHFLVVV